MSGLFCFRLFTTQQHNAPSNCNTEEKVMATSTEGVTIWLTGLSGAGKSTIATTLAERLESAGSRVEVLDGNEVRRNNGNFLEIFVNGPLGTRLERDAKGPYRMAFAGVITAFTGVADLYEPPAKPDLELHTDRESVDESVERVLGLLRDRGYLADGQAA
jgi:adenylylsulfate kinase